ncbi:hypothetical protein ACFPM0_03930 [Pseudonocardia sulfidoxydans]|uniref:hypothetical protein n=1 Tax=Pseudonocardia sulfidoxydans TaxID=54011 RepID=UPI00361D212F
MHLSVAEPGRTALVRISARAGANVSRAPGERSHDTLVARHETERVISAGTLR